VSVTHKKVCMLGSFAVGKTSLVRRYVHSIFSDKYQTTVGVKLEKKTVPVDSGEVVMVIWDIYGETEFQSIHRSYLRGAAGLMLVADGTRQSSVDALAGIRALALEESPNATGILLLNKADLATEWRLNSETERKLAEGNWPVLRTSAKTGEGVEEAFLALARQMV